LQLQNRGAANQSFAIGDEVHIAIDADSMRILAD